MYHVLIQCVHDDVGVKRECHVEFQIYAHTSPFRHLKYLILIRCQVKSVKCESLVVVYSGHVQVLVRVHFAYTSKHGIKTPHLQTVCKVQIQRMHGV